MLTMELVGNMCVGGLVVDVCSIFQAFVAEGWMDECDTVRCIFFDTKII